MINKSMLLRICMTLLARFLLLLFVRSDWILQSCWDIQCLLDDGCFCIDSEVVCELDDPNDDQECEQTCKCRWQDNLNTNSCPFGTVNVGTAVSASVGGIVAKVCADNKWRSPIGASAPARTALSSMLPSQMKWTWRGGMIDFRAALGGAIKRSAIKDSSKIEIINATSTEEEKKDKKKSKFFHKDIKILNSYIKYNNNRFSRNDLNKTIYKWTGDDDHEYALHSAISTNTSFGVHMSRSRSSILQKRAVEVDYLWYYFWLDRQPYNPLPDDILTSIAGAITHSFPNDSTYTGGCFRVNFNYGGNDGFWVMVDLQESAYIPTSQCNGYSPWTKSACVVGQGLAVFIESSKHIPATFNNIQSNCLPINTILQECEKFTSPNGKYFAVLQGDGNLVVVRAYDTKPLSQGTGAHNVADAPFIFAYQGDSNLVVYNKYNGAPWSSKTWGYGSSTSHLCMQNDGNLVLYKPGGTPIWSSGTYQ